MRRSEPRACEAPPKGHRCDVRLNMVQKKFSVRSNKKKTAVRANVYLVDGAGARLVFRNTKGKHPRRLLTRPRLRRASAKGVGFRVSGLRFRVQGFAAGIRDVGRAPQHAVEIQTGGRGPVLVGGGDGEGGGSFDGETRRTRYFAKILQNRFYFLAAVTFSAQLTLQERVVVHHVHGRAVGGIMSSTWAFM